jgi:hypothetical protein
MRHAHARARRRSGTVNAFDLAAGSTCASKAAYPGRIHWQHAGRRRSLVTRRSLGGGTHAAGWAGALLVTSDGKEAGPTISSFWRARYSAGTCR